MTRLSKVWDFSLGVALIASAPIFSLVFLASISRYLPDSKLVWFGMLLISFLTYVAACIWRSKRRLLPRSFLAWEILVATVTGVLFMVVYTAAGFAAYGAD